MNPYKEFLVKIHFFHKVSAKESKYLILLFVLAFLLLVSPFFRETYVAKLYFSFIITFFVAVGLYADIERKRIDYIELALGILAFIFTWVDYAIAEKFSIVLTTQLIYALYFFYFTVELIAKIIITEKISANLIYASIVGFLMLGLLGATLASIIGLTFPNAYSISTNIGHYRFENYIYYSFISITTVGYGDMIPVQPAAKMLAIILCVSGHFYSTIIMSIIIGKYIGSISKAK